MENVRSVGRELLTKVSWESASRSRMLDPRAAPRPAAPAILRKSFRLLRCASASAPGMSAGTLFILARSNLSPLEFFEDRSLFGSRSHPYIDHTPSALLKSTQIYSNTFKFTQ